jgi:hypothetical protein
MLTGLWWELMRDGGPASSLFFGSAVKACWQRERVVRSIVQIVCRTAYFRRCFRSCASSLRYSIPTFTLALLLPWNL